MYTRKFIFATKHILFNNFLHKFLQELFAFCHFIFSLIFIFLFLIFRCILLIKSIFSKVRCYLTVKLNFYVIYSYFMMAVIQKRVDSWYKYKNSLVVILEFLILFPILDIWASKLSFLIIILESYAITLRKYLSF